MPDIAIGIDLGTYNSAAAYVGAGGRAEMIQSQYGLTAQGTVFPSFVKFDAGGGVQAFGEDARRQMALAPRQVVWGVKRLIGRSYGQVEAERARYLYPIAEAPDGGVWIPFGDRRYTPAEISGLILADIKQAAEASFNPEVVGAVHKAVVTHPAYFDALQIQETRNAAARAGFAEVELLPEPVAAALAYGMRLDPRRSQFVLAVDWGAGTLDIVAVALRLDAAGKPALDQVRPACGNVQLGGIDMDDALLDRVLAVNHLGELQALKEKLRAGAPVSVGDPLLRTLGDLRLRVEEAKIKLSSLRAASEAIAYRGGQLLVKMARTSADRLDEGGDWVILEDTLAPLLRRFAEHVAFALRESGLAATDFDHLLLIGGPMYMPCVRQALAGLFRGNAQVRQELEQIESAGFPVSPLECVAKGAALNAGSLGTAPPPDELAYDYGLLLRDSLGQSAGRLLLHRGQRVPCKAKLGPLGTRGRPGDVIPVSLYKREVGPGGDRHVWMGDYRFAPAFDERGWALFEGTLQADDDGVVSAFWSDVRATGAPLPLGGLWQQRGEPLASPPADFPEVEMDEGVAQGRGGAKTKEPADEMQDMRPGKHISAIPAPHVEAARRGGQTLLKLAKAALAQQPALRSNSGAAGEMRSLMSGLEKALGRLPRGQARYQDWAQSVHSAEALLALLRSLGAVSEDDLRLIRGDLEAGQGR